MHLHPFKPIIPDNAKKLLIGTLPPESAPFYYSNSSNTRLWDILTAINEGTPIVGKGGYLFDKNRKIQLLKDLNIGMTDIILEYERAVPKSPSDKDIIPKRYNDVLQLAVKHNIEEFLFVYQSTWKWFIHSQQRLPPVTMGRLTGLFQTGPQATITHQGKQIKCTLLPSPLSRGTKGLTLAIKLEMYKQYIYA